MKVESPGKAFPMGRKSAKKSSTKKALKKENDSENSPVKKRSSPMKSSMGAFGSPAKKLLMNIGEDTVISPFKANRPDTSQSRCINLLE
jgi:hypothetical protein